MLASFRGEKPLFLKTDLISVSANFLTHAVESAMQSNTGFSGDTSLGGGNDITRMETNVFSHSGHEAFNSTLGETAGFTGVSCTPLGYVLLKCVCMCV